MTKISGKGRRFQVWLFLQPPRHWSRIRSQEICQSLKHSIVVSWRGGYVSNQTTHFHETTHLHWSLRAEPRPGLEVRITYFCIQGEFFMTHYWGKAISSEIWATFNAAREVPWSVLLPPQQLLGGREGVHLLAYPTKNVACTSSLVCSSAQGPTSLPGLLLSMTALLKGQVFPWTGL